MLGNKKKPLFFSLALLFALFVYFNGVRVLKKIPGIDFFGDTSYFRMLTESEAERSRWHQTLLGTKDWRGDAQRNRLLLDEYARRRAAGLVGVGEGAAYHERFEALSEASFASLARETGSYHSKAAGDAALFEARRDEDLKPLRTPALLMAHAAAVYTGRTIDYSVAEGVRATSRTKMRNSVFGGQEMHFKTPYLSTMMDYTRPADPASGVPAATPQEDTLRTGVYQDFRGPGVRTSAIYGTTTGSTTLGLSKSITESLSVNVDQTSGGSSKKGENVSLGFTTGF